MNKFLVLLFIITYASSKCLKDYKDNQNKRNFYYNGMSLPIIIETSDRASHLFVNNILHTLFTEVLKYKTVKMIYKDHPIDYIKAVERLSNLSEDGVPQTMINLEIWLPHTFEAKLENVLEVGPLGPIGRFGWFMPSKVIENSWKNSGIILNNWRFLKNGNITELFSIELRNLQGNLNSQRGGSWCDVGYNHLKRGGLLVNNKTLCHGARNHNCGVLFSSYTDLDRGFLVEQIAKYGFHSNVAWLGDNLKCLVHRAHQSGMPIMFFDWIPSDLTSMADFESIHFPSSRDFDHPLVKQYILTKMAWRVIKSHLPEVHHIVSQIRFSEDDLKQELAKFPMKWTEGIVQQLACDWLRNNPEKWRTWIPADVVKKTPIYLAGLFPKALPGIREGARMAVEMMNDDEGILGDYEIVLMSSTISCDEDAATLQFLRSILNTSKQITAVIGPTCYEAGEPIARLTSYFNKPVISFGSHVRPRKKSTSELYFDVMPNIGDVGEIYINILKLLKATKMTVIRQNDEPFLRRYSLMKEKADANSVDVTYEAVVNGNEESQKIAEVIREVKSSPVRFVVLLADVHLSLRLLCSLSHQEESLTHEHVWFLPHVIAEDHASTEEAGCSVADVLGRLKGSFVVRPSTLGSPDTKLPLRGSTVGEWSRLYHARLDALAMKVSSYGSYAFDAVLTFGMTLNNLISEDPASIESFNKVETLKKFSSHMESLRIEGVTGLVNFMNHQRKGRFDIFQIQKNGTLRAVGTFDFLKNSSERTSMNTSQMMSLQYNLFDSRFQAPHSCSVEKVRAILNVECDAAIIIINVVCLSLLVVLIVCSLLVIKRRYDFKVIATCDRMEELGLFSQDISWLCLDQWEVARDNVVLNRKLGEGAFGTVFGGEANIGGVWVASAVKTLKISSKPDEKLDFLSEAEMMKRFNHENIVKLLGVCTRGEPTLAIMEFMLHGDLKTFLLSRRQLVGQSGREAEDVSPFQLTKMALDVTHGLFYLSSLNYVHRDLACRNCLVHANKTVKIGDFGMTRSMNDSDYYRFNKRGMFPVRWMAPESLSDGLFGTASDVWSYGVLLYEIITFGSFPYQGLSNRQVLNFVKSGNVLSMPAECPPKVESLLKRCWAFDPKNRPRVVEIIEILTETPILLTPCLDTPSTSVHIDGPWSLEMKLLPRVRHRNQYQKNFIVSDRMSAPTGTNNQSMEINSSRLSSPPFCQHLNDDADDREDKMETLKLRSSSCDLIAVEEFKNVEHQGSGTVIQCEMDESFLSQDTTHLCHANFYPDGKLKEGSLPLVKRSLSADDKTLFDARHWGNVSSRICRLYADKIRSKMEEIKKPERSGCEKSSIKRKTLLPVLSSLGEQEGFATEPRLNNRRSFIGPSQLTCDSRTDSDYCSQHSKDFSVHIGTALL